MVTIKGFDRFLKKKKITSINTDFLFFFNSLYQLYFTGVWARQATDQGKIQNKLFSFYKKYKIILLVG